MANGYHKFVAGEKPPAATLNDYLAKQALLKYGSAALRNADATLSADCREGMVSYQDDTNCLIVQRDATLANISTVGPVHGALPTGPTLTISQPGALTTTVNGNTTFRIGRMIYLNCFITITSAGTTANDIVITGHVAAAGSVEMAGTFEYIDTSTGVYTGSVIVTASGLKLRRDNTAVGQFLGTSTALAAANGDFLSLLLWYPAGADG